MKKRYRRPWKEELKDLFSMHAAERRGFLVLLWLCFVAAGWVIYEQWIRPSPVDDLAKLQVAYAELKLSAGRMALFTWSTPSYFRNWRRK